MLERLRRWMGRGRAGESAWTHLPTVSREEGELLWHRPDGLPRVDWDMAAHWISRRADTVHDEAAWRRALMAACLDEVRDSLDRDHVRWRSANVEGLAPLGGIVVGKAMSTVAERAFRALRKDLRTIRPDEPIAPIALVAIEPADSYVDFTNSYFLDEGAFAMSGGLYLNEGPEAFPLIAVNAASRHGCEATVAHELTHHALHGTGLPSWVEEGIAQMMEERIALAPDFKLDAEMVQRQRDLWSTHDIDSFLDGSAFLCPVDDMQELSYHLAQWVVRGELTRRPDAFFAFARACRGQDPDEACHNVLGVSPRQLVLAIIGVEDE
jgi:hypothetical protein